MAHGVPERLDGLRGNHRLAAAAHGGRDHQREAHAILDKDLIDRDERGLGIERIKNRFNQQQVDAALDQRAHLPTVIGRHLVERHHAEAGIVGVG
jgi:hypothetical protein